MKIRNLSFLFFVTFTLLLAGCNDSKQSKTQTTKEATENDVKTDKQTSADNNPDITAPDFADPVLREYYASYTAYLNKVVAAIRNKDEATTMKLFSEEGKKLNNRNEMDQKAKSAEEQKFTTWLLQTVDNYKEIVQSPYFKKFNDEYYKKVKEDFKEKGY